MARRSPATRAEVATSSCATLSKLCYPHRLSPARFVVFLWFAFLVGQASLCKAVPLRLASFNVEQGFEEPGTTSFDQAKAIIARVSPDVLAVVEAQSGSDTNNFFLIAEQLGYPHAAISGSTTLDTTLRTGVFSRYPILSTNAVRSPEGAVEMTRQNIVVKIDVPGTPNDPLIVVMHPKCCGSGLGQESFRRAIEMRRARETVEASSIPAIDNVFVVGDFNLVGTDVSFSSLPSGLPGRYKLDTNVVFPVIYRTNPAYYFAGTGIEQVPMAQVNGQTKTWTTRSSSSSVLDYIMASAPVRARGFQTEIYSSVLDTAGGGLPKPGPIPATNASSLAADHFFLFGDFELGGPEPAPVISWPVAAPIVGGQALGEAHLSGGAAAIPGVFAFASPEEIPPAGTIEREVVFTPEDTLDYTAVSQAVRVTVLHAVGAGFAAWSGGESPTETLLASYAIGGASSPSAHDGISAVTELAGEDLRITALVRTDDPDLEVRGETIGSFGEGWTEEGVSVRGEAEGVYQGGVAAGFERRIYAVPRSGTQRYLRLRAVLGGE